jgi:hypothetical protein
MGRLWINPRHALYIGDRIIQKYRVQMLEHGAFKAARNLRKQGIPLEAALLILLGKEGVNGVH